MFAAGPRGLNVFFAAAWLAVPLAVFGAFFHWQILDPRRVTWLLQGDWGAHVLGWNALRHEPWRWPLGATRLLAWPTGVTVTYTDSNPLVCLLLKPFSGLLPTPFQFTGVWLFSCILLQFACAYLLVRPHAPGRWSALAGASLFALTPTLLNRQGHADLCAHWTILLSLHAFINVRRDGRRDALFALLLTLSALIHPYFLPMNAAIWASDVLRRGVRAVRGRDPKALATVALRGVAVVAAPLAALWATGAFGGFRGEGGGFGYYSMALDALFNPGSPGHSRFLPLAPQGEGQVFEGFQYLGLGLLTLLAVALISLAGPARRGSARRMGWLAWLGPALFVLFALALSDHIQWHGRVVARLSYDWIPLHLTDTFRSSGRLFWPCAYALILAGLMQIFALAPGWSGVALVLALGLQVADLTGFAATMRALTADAVQPNHFTRMTSRKWDPLIAAADLVDFEPPDPHADQTAFYEIAWRASSLGRPVNTMYTSRPNPQQQTAEADAHRRFLSGQLDPRHLYVLVSGCTPPNVDPERVKLVNFVRVIPPAGVAFPFALRPAPPPDPLPLGKTLSVADEQLRCALGTGWSDPESWGVWSDGPEANLVLRGVDAGRDLILTLTARGYPLQGQGVSVMAGGRRLARLQLADQGGSYAVRLPREIFHDGRAVIAFKVDHPAAPAESSNSPDARKLGVALASLRLDPAP